METMSTSDPKLGLEMALGAFPAALRKRLLKAYRELKTHSLEGELDAIGTRAGRLAEVILRAIQFKLQGAFTPLSQGLPNFKSECERLERLPASSSPEGLRVLMPRALCFLYTLRNKRDFGHSGGEVDANKIDAGTAVAVSDWCVAELVRVCHSIPIEDAQLLCDAIAERRLPIVWKVLGRKRILSASLSYADQTLLFLYSALEFGVAVEDLLLWTEHPKASNYRRDVLAKLHAARFLEWDRETEMAVLSPLGARFAERTLLPRLATLPTDA